ncbi:MAG: Ppx/GppA phosphatase family protein [Pseudomonadota bacterium]
MVAVPKRHGFTVVDSFSRIVRLGEGLATTGRIADDAADRTLEALKRCAEIVARWGVADLRCVTTEACRLASNGAEFVDRVRRETGLNLQVIGAEQEAALAVLGCRDLVSSRSDHAVIFDIGGGSTELSWVMAERQKNGRRTINLIESVSLPFGVVRLSDGLAPGGFAGEHYEGIKKRITHTIKASDAYRRHQSQLDPSHGHLIGTSGTATSLAAFNKGMKRYRRREIDGSWLAADDIGRLAAQLTAIGPEARAQEPCIGYGRADLIMPGCAILEAIIEATGYSSVRVADRGLREGIISELITRTAPHPRSPSPAFAAE